MAVIGSGAGTTAESIVEASESGDLAAEGGRSIGNKSRSGIFDGARRHGTPRLHLSTVTHPGDEERATAMLQALGEVGAGLIVLAGYAKKIGPRVLATYQ